MVVRYTVWISCTHAALKTLPLWEQLDTNKMEQLRKTWFDEAVHTNRTCDASTERRRVAGAAAAAARLDSANNDDQDSGDDSTAVDMCGVSGLYESVD